MSEEKINSSDLIPLFIGITGTPGYPRRRQGRFERKNLSPF